MSRYMLIVTIALFGFLYAAGPCAAQKVIRLDKVSSLKTKKIFIGDEVTFQLHRDDDTWYTETVLDILPDINSIRFSNRLVKADRIKAIRETTNRQTGRTLERTLQTFGAGWGLFALIGSLGGYELQRRDLIVPLSSLALGRILYWALKQKTYKIGKRYRILLLDLNPLPAPENQSG